MSGGGDARWLRAPVHGLVARVFVAEGETVAAGQPLLLQEAMKMEVPLAAPAAGAVRRIAAVAGEVVPEGEALVLWAPAPAGAEPARGKAPVPAAPGGGSGAQAAAAASAAIADGSAAAPADDGGAVPVEVAGQGADARSGPTASAAESASTASAASAAESAAGPVEPPLDALRRRLAQLEDAARPQAAAQRRAAGRLTAREIVAAVLDAGSFAEYGALAVAAQRTRRPLAELEAATPADGLVTGTGTLGGRPLAVMVYDYTVLAGTQGVFNHAKADRLLALARQRRLPLLLWAEGGGGRPGDVDWLGVAGLDCPTFAALASLSGEVPTVGIGAGRCFAGNAALLGCCDLVIATDGSSLGLGGPAMIEGGGLGVVAADDVGPADDLAAAGAVDVRVADDAAALAAAKALLALLSDAREAAGIDPARPSRGGRTATEGGSRTGTSTNTGSDSSSRVGAASAQPAEADARAAEAAAATRAAADGPTGGGTDGPGPDPAGGTAAQTAAFLRRAVPEGRRAVFDPRPVVEAIVDRGSHVALRPAFGRSVAVGLARLGGRPVAVAASDPRHLGGALDAPSCDQLARLMQLADAHGLPLVTFVDTPGFMVGPASERTGMLRHAARVFVAASHLRVPVLTVVWRRGFGLGAMALAAGHFHAPLATAAWPAAEFGAMGLEGAVRLGFRRELAAAPEAGRAALFERLLAEAAARGQALNMASHLEIDAVIDPADTRDWLLRHLAAAGAAPLGPRRPFVDPW